jgi:hypothetical protein
VGTYLKLRILRNITASSSIPENLPLELNQGLIDIYQSFKRIMIFGVPTSGKGTQCELITAKVH